jgi:hypothetical protein
VETLYTAGDTKQIIKSDKVSTFIWTVSGSNLILGTTLLRFFVVSLSSLINVVQSINVRHAHLLPHLFKWTVYCQEVRCSIRK